MSALLFFAGAWVKRFATSLLDHWRIYAVAALLLAYGWHRHVVEQRDAARHAIEAVQQAFEQAVVANENNAAELRRLTDSLAEMQRRIATAGKEDAAAAALLDQRAQTVTKEIIRHADPSFCPASPSLRAAVDGLRKLTRTGDADGSTR
jgi:hypothetical protein